jgi:hypothetical protein
LTYFGKIQFLPPCIWNLPFMSTASEESELVIFICRARPLMLTLPHPPRFFWEVRTGFYLPGAAAAATASPAKVVFYWGQNRFLPAGRGRCCYWLTAKVVFLRGQNRFLPVGWSRSCHCLAAKVFLSEVKTGFYLPGAAAAATASPPRLFF